MSFELWVYVNGNIMIGKLESTKCKLYFMSVNDSLNINLWIKEYNELWWVPI